MIQLRDRVMSRCFVSGARTLGRTWVAGLMFGCLSSGVWAADALPKTPVLHVPFLEKAPVIDGRIDAAEWAGAARITGFMTYGESVMVPAMLQPVWWIAWDDQNLYFAQTLPLYPKGTIVATEKRSDNGGANAGVGNALLFGDHIEIQLATVARRIDVLDDHFYKLVINPYGAMEDARRRHTVGWAGLEWESEARSKSKVTESTWSVEVAVPLKSLGYTEPPKDMTRLYAQLVSAADSEMFYTAWVPASWLSWDLFPELYLRRSAPAVQVNFASGPEEGPLDMDVRVVNRTAGATKVTAEVTAHYMESSDPKDEAVIMVEIQGDDLSILIGRRSETLNALQYISSLIVGKELGEWAPMMIDVQGYRARRDRQLRQIARRMAEQAIHTGKRQVLEPMPANERRIIHMELHDHPQVATESLGEEPNRKVTIALKK